MILRFMLDNSKHGISQSQRTEPIVGGEICSTIFDKEAKELEVRIGAGDGFTACGIGVVFFGDTRFVQKN